jgi:hypothetical protein
VEKAVGRYKAYRRGREAGSFTDGVPELLVYLHRARRRGRLGGGQLRAPNLHRAGGPLKAVAIWNAALALSAEGIDTTMSIRGADPARLKQVKKARLGVTGGRGTKPRDSPLTISTT